MEILEQQNGELLVRLTPDDFVALSNALNETIEHLEEWEFETRMGVTKSEVEKLRSIFRQVRIGN